MKERNGSSVCANCVMDTTDNKIIFDEKGVCDHCNTFYTDIQPFWHTDERGQKQLSELVSKIRKEGEGRKYDCLIGLSGGFDSSYLLYVMVAKYGLRPLVFNVDTGWSTKLAEENIANLVKGLGVELHTEVIDWKEMRDLQLAYFKAGVSNIDTPQDHACFAVMYQFAHKHKIKTILTGGNYSTECVRNPVEWMYFQSDVIQLKDIHKRFGTIKLKKFPLTNILWHKVWLPYIEGVRLYRPLDLMPYNKALAGKELEEKFNFNLYPQKHFENIFTKFYESYWLPKKFGYDTRKVQFSSLILTGQMTRKEAVEKLTDLPYNPRTIEEEKKIIADKLEITIEDLDSYMNIPNKTYKNYKSQENIYNIGSKVMRLLRIEKGGKR